MNRRTFLSHAAAAAATASIPSLLRGSSPPLLRGRADRCIFIWLGGGMSQIDTFDPKKPGNSKTRTARTEYAAIETAVPGVRYTEHLTRTARLAEHVTAVRTINHRLGIEHALATNFIHTGRPISGSTIYPSVGSVVAHERGAVSDDIPVGYPSVSRGPGFLGAKHGYIYLVDTETGPAGFTPPAGIDRARSARRQRLLAPLQNRAEDASPLGEYEMAQ